MPLLASLKTQKPGKAILDRFANCVHNYLNLNEFPTQSHKRQCLGLNLLTIQYGLRYHVDI
jgi:hypothetical protein